MASAHVLLLTVIAAVVISVIVDLFVRDILFHYSAMEGICMNTLNILRALNKLSAQLPLFMNNLVNE